MSIRIRHALLACCALAGSPLVSGHAMDFSFAVIAQASPTSPNEVAVQQAITETDADNLAFVVANGIKAATEPCTDDVYKQRKNFLDRAKNGLIVSIAGDDWSDCRNAQGKSTAAERLNRLREYFFVDEFSFGASRIPVMRQSRTAKFRSYAENTRWEMGDIMFATVNLPANNNHYLPDAGRNSEFEDRLVANRDWLQRIFTFAANKKMAGIVLFCDGNPFGKPDATAAFSLSGRRDGFVETRQQINLLTTRFAGKVLIVHGGAEKSLPSPERIVWHKNVGEVNVAAGIGWLKLSVSSSAPAIFSVYTEAGGTQTAHKKTGTQPEHADQ